MTGLATGAAYGLIALGFTLVYRLTGMLALRPWGRRHRRGVRRRAAVLGTTPIAAPLGVGETVVCWRSSRSSRARCCRSRVYVGRGAPVSRRTCSAGSRAASPPGCWCASCSGCAFAQQAYALPDPLGSPGTIGARRRRDASRSGRWRCWRSGSPRACWSSASLAVTGADAVMRAVADDAARRRACSASRPSASCSRAFALAGALAGLAGLLIAPQAPIGLQDGVLLGLKGMAAALLFRLGSLPLAIAGGLGDRRRRRPRSSPGPASAPAGPTSRSWPLLAARGRAGCGDDRRGARPVPVRGRARAAAARWGSRGCPCSPQSAFVAVGGLGALQLEQAGLPIGGAVLLATALGAVAGALTGAARRARRARVRRAVDVGAGLAGARCCFPSRAALTRPAFDTVQTPFGATLRADAARAPDRRGGALRARLRGSPRGCARTRSAATRWRSREDRELARELRVPFAARQSAAARALRRRRPRRRERGSRSCSASPPRRRLPAARAAAARRRAGRDAPAAARARRHRRAPARADLVTPLVLLAAVLARRAARPVARPRRARRRRRRWSPRTAGWRSAICT